MSINQNFPEVSPSLLLDFANSRTLDPRITFTRSSIGTYVASNGLIKTAAADEPRFDHDPETGESLGLLIEESRTNIVHGNPGQSNIVVTSGQANSLTGNNDAYKLAKNSPSSNQSHGSWGVNGNVSTTSYVMSIFVKKINHSKFFLQTVAQSADNLYVYFDIDTGATSYTDFTTPGNLTVTTSIETYTDGWYRIISRVQGFAANTLASGFRLGFGDPSSGSQQYINTDDEVLVYGAQIEDGSFATSYIPTSGSAVTRQPDNASITGTNFSSWYNQSEGTVFADVNTYVSKAYQTLLNITKATTLSHRQLLGSNQLYCNVGDVDIPIAPTAGSQKVAYSIDSSNVIVYKLAALQGSDSSFTLNAADLLEIGAFESGRHLNGHISRLAYYPQRLTDSQLQNLTK